MIKSHLAWGWLQIASHWSLVCWQSGPCWHDSHLPVAVLHLANCAGWHCAEHVALSENVPSSLSVHCGTTVV